VPANLKSTPDQNSPEWVKEQAEAADKDRREIRSICPAC